ncbi:hypothetical protein J8F10_33670 [Gemmata sp. G18]|uniref:Uncharacterized protein n=1 Tax=Gemmata palustris TaxID=2822762 RepID=A0ABS5C2J4_9BACT|nr:hypothetical protein [Gemmata palustris]MBP3960203.1 hypothetical protein [Gemmata palustris]
MSVSRYNVRQLGWYQPPHGDPYTRRAPAATPVASFDTFDDAEMHRRGRESAAREAENPFRFGGCSVFFQSSLDGPRLHDWLMDAGIDPPVSELRHDDWRAWWEAFAHTWSAEQLAHAWAAFDKVRFFDVVEEPPKVAHIVIEIAWGVINRDWNAMTAGTEGGQVIGVYGRARTAEVVLSRQRRTGNDGRARYRYGRRAGYPNGMNESLLAHNATFFETVAVPSNVPPFAGVGFLVQRRAVIDTFVGTAWRDRPSTSARVPIALFAARAEAVEHRDRLAAECRLQLNPFVFADPARSATTDTMREELAALDLPLPIPVGDRRRNWTDWAEWWDLCQDEVTDEQREAVWGACDQPLFEVIRVEVSDE